MHHEPIAAGRARSDKSARRRARPNAPRLKRPTPPPDLLPAPVDARGRPLSAERVKWKVERRLLQEGLSPGELAFATATLDFSPGGQVTTAAMQTIADRAGMGRSTAFKIRGALVARGIITTEPQHDDDGAQTTSKHAIAPAVFERAEVFFSWPTPSRIGTGPRPGSGHKRDPFPDLDPLSGSGSVDLSDDGNERDARARAIQPPAFLSSNDEPAFVELATLHAAAHAAKYRPEAERRGEVYSTADAGSLAAEHRPAVAAELRNLASRAHAAALAKGRDDLSLEAIRSDLTARIVREYIAQERPYLREHRHPLGCLWGKGGADGKPCDLLSLGARVLDAWCDALDPAEPPDFDEFEREDREAARAACAELRARLAAAAVPPELPAQLPDELLVDELHNDDEHGAAAELLDEPHDVDDQEHGTAAELLDELRPARPELPPRGQRVTAEQLAELARIEADTRERVARHRARRTRRGGRASIPTRPRERLAFFAALLALAAPLAALDGPEHEPHDERPAAAPWTAAAAPLLRDARERPARRRPRRRRAPPQRP